MTGPAVGEAVPSGSAERVAAGSAEPWSAGAGVRVRVGRLRDGVGDALGEAPEEALTRLCDFGCGEEGVSHTMAPPRATAVRPETTAMTTFLPRRPRGFARAGSPAGVSSHCSGPAGAGRASPPVHASAAGGRVSSRAHGSGRAPS